MNEILVSSLTFAQSNALTREKNISFDFPFDSTMASSSTASTSSAIPTGFYYDYELGEDSSALLTKAPNQLYQEYVAKHTSGTKKDLPNFRAYENLYSSTATLLKKTKTEVEEYAKDLGALSMVMDFPTGSEVRATVAKMFADPRGADAVADQEWRRREEVYQMAREQLNEKLQAHMRREKEALQRELLQLGSVNAAPSATTTGGSGS